MIILWIRKSKAGLHNNVTPKEMQNFQQHDDIMKQFRLAHPDINLMNSKDFVMSDGNLLAPVHEVKLAANIQN